VYIKSPTQNTVTREYILRGCSLYLQHDQMQLSLWPWSCSGCICMAHNSHARLPHQTGNAPE